MREGFEVPLLGIARESVLETCDCCGNSIPLLVAVFTGS